MKPSLAFVLSALLLGGLANATPSRGRFGAPSIWSEINGVASGPAAIATGPGPITTDGGIILTAPNGAGTAKLTGDSSGNLTSSGALTVTGTAGLNFATASGRLTWASGRYIDTNETTGDLRINSLGLALAGNRIIAAAAPTITSACTSPTVTHSTGTASFQIDVGATCAGISTVVLALPTVINGWSCLARHKTVVSSSAAELDCAGDTTTAITCTNFTRGTSVALAFTDGDDLVFVCTGR